MKHKKIFIAIIVFILITSLGCFIFRITPDKTGYLDSEDEIIVLEDDESIPLSPPTEMPNEYKSGYGITWTRENNDKTYYSDLFNSVDLSVIGNLDKRPVLVGLSREEAENIVGTTITELNNVRISSLNTNSKGYYLANNNLVILYYDTVKPEKVLFSVKMNTDLAEKTRYFISPNLDDYLIEDFENMTMELLNTVRAAYGKMPLVIDKQLGIVSRIHSQTMVSGDYFSHINKSGLSPKDRLNAVEVKFKTYSEALTAGTWTPMDVITTWMNSPLHREILLGDYTAGGIGISTGESTYGIYVTLNVISK